MSAGVGQKWKLLLAEDEPVQRLLFQRTLKEQGYEVDTASSGEEALAKVLGGGIHILLTDWDMPGLDGAELCRRIRRAKLPDYLYILMITAHSSASDTVFAITAGANDYIRKPLDKAELLARLRSACELVGVQRELRAAIDNLSAANAEIERMSWVDPQLRCYNKRYLNDQLPRAIAHATRHKEALALVMADLDAFKRINDTHGHMVGDEVLCGFVARSSGSLRASDWIARFGGEEFAIILPATDAQGAREVAEKLRVSCAAEPFQCSGGRLNVTVSLGVTALPPLSVDQAQSPAELEMAMNGLLARADAALYCSKHQGRNMVSIAL
jgi:two-component system chemotaxis response regulator CheY